MKILVIAGLDASLLNFRLPLLLEMRDYGLDVVCCAPPDDPTVASRLAALGVRFIPVEMSRTGLNPVNDFKAWLALRQICAQERPDLVLGYTIKPVIFGSLAAAATGVPRIYSLITGLGTAFQIARTRDRILRGIVVNLYRIALRRCDRVFVQNEEIGKIFRREKIASEDQIVTVMGSGVDVYQFAASAVDARTPVFLLLGRLLKDKGLREFADAAKQIASERKGVRFQIAGGAYVSPNAIEASKIAEWKAEGIVEVLDQVHDVRPLLQACSIYVLPSYHEGMPRSVLEAMAVGRAIITTDTIGCRDTVRHSKESSRTAEGVIIGENGLLVPPRDSKALAAAMRYLLDRPHLVDSMGRRSREIAEEIFDVRKVNQMMMRHMGLAKGSAPMESPEREGVHSR